MHSSKFLFDKEVVNLFQNTKQEVVGEVLPVLYFSNYNNFHKEHVYGQNIPNLYKWRLTTSCHKSVKMSSSLFNFLLWITHVVSSFQMNMKIFIDLHMILLYGEIWCNETGIYNEDFFYLTYQSRTLKSTCPTWNCFTFFRKSFPSRIGHISILI